MDPRESVAWPAVLAAGDNSTPALIIAAAGLLIGFVLLRVVAAQDRRGWLAARAPQLPIRLVSVHDDAWIRGVVETDEPLACPWFGTHCAHYSYRSERYVTHTRVDSDGKTHTTSSWETADSASETVPFRLVQDGVAIPVAGPEGSFEHLQSTGYDYEHSSLRHSAELLPVGGIVSALGVKRDDGTFGPLREVPLLVTGRERDLHLRAADRFETWMRWFAYGIPWLAGGAAFLVWRADEIEPAAIALAVACGLALWLPVWCLATWNRFVAQRNQVETAWRQIDVDLEVRDQLLPSLVAVVGRYAEHEQETLAQVAAVRGGGSVAAKIAADAQARTFERALVSIREAYPDLAADRLFADLHERLWALEEKLQVSRTLYDRVTREWNDLVEGFPTCLLAPLARAKRRPTFGELSRGGRGVAPATRT